MASYTMKETCAIVDLSYETLKYYCKIGLVPHVKRDERNRRIFDDRDIAWIQSLICVRDCGMGIDEMRAYLNLCLAGESSIPERQQILAHKRAELVRQKDRIQASIAFIDYKQDFFRKVLEGKEKYRSNLIDVD
ncbi:MerR family transcriptional regulator [Alloscardovia criceti]|uniref:MerR family transcriptional regulator n=1 Tax=Alloscardovia criceti TaxID=356828 RepID=UPI000373E819|nr:MerR family transcriptional regulator [Alloscardovia criceti]